MEKREPPAIFVSYRIDDTGDVADRLTDDLKKAFGQDTVFLDHRSIPAGNNWENELRAAARNASVVVALIGSKWLTVQDKHGRRRIDVKNDWVRCEIEAALERDRLIPVLVNEAPPIEKAAIAELPIAGLASIQALRLRRTDWPSDVAKIVATLTNEKFGLAARKQEAGHAEKQPPTDRPTAGSQPSSHDHAADLQDYRVAMEEAHGTLALVGFETRVRVPVQLDDLYVPLRAQVAMEAQESHYADAADAEESLRHFRHHEDLALTEAFSTAAAHKPRGIMILGDPGSGKTTQLKRMLLGTLRQGSTLLGLPDDVVPVFLPLRLLEAEDLEDGFDKLLARTFPPASPLRAEVAKTVCAAERRLYLIDGLDEVPSALRPDVCNWIKGAITHDPNGFYAVTSRYAGYDKLAREALGERFLELHLRPLGQEQVADFVRRWYDVIETCFDPANGQAKGAEKANELISRLQEPAFRAQRVTSLTKNPLLLTNVCLVHRDRGSYLPQGRERLYRECLNVLLELWRRAKSMNVSLTAERAREALQPVALFLHEVEGRTRAPMAELVPVLTTPLAQVEWKGTPQQFLDAIRDESGLLTGWSHTDLGFLHLGFQEYLAACEIQRQVTQAAVEEREAPPWLDLLAEQFGEPWWREVTLLLLALEGASLFGPLFTRVVESDAFAANEDLVAECLEEARHKDPAPFAALLDRDASEDPSLLARQLVAARALERIAPEEVEKRQAKFEASASREIRERFGTRGQRGGEVVVHEASGIELVPIPGGAFVMGSPDDELDRFGREGPQREVHVQPFSLARTPVTNAQYARFLEATAHDAPENWDNRNYNRPEQPVVGVSWKDARAFCTWAGLVLPSEAQWEYACRGGTSTRFWSGDAEEDLARAGWFEANSDGQLHAVGEKPANPWGLYDMHGNVWEWCGDHWHESYEGAPKDGSAWVSGGSGLRVIRGGSWWFVARRCRSASRDWSEPGLRLDDVGFRPASSRH